MMGAMNPAMMGMNPAVSKASITDLDDELNDDESDGNVAKDACAKCSNGKTKRSKQSCPGLEELTKQHYNFLKF